MTVMESERDQYIAAKRLIAGVDARHEYDSRDGQKPTITTEEADADESWLTIFEAAKFMKFALRTVQGWARSGDLPTHGKGKGKRVKRSACERFLRQRREK